jgi:hypothetical protein
LTADVESSLRPDVTPGTLTPEWKTAPKLILVFQQLLQIFYKTNHNDHGRSCHSKEEEWYDDLRNTTNDKIHTQRLYLPSSVPLTAQC